MCVCVHLSVESVCLHLYPFVCVCVFRQSSSDNPSTYEFFIMQNMQSGFRAIFIYLWWWTISITLQIATFYPNYSFNNRHILSLYVTLVVMISVLLSVLWFELPACPLISFPPHVACTRRPKLFPHPPPVLTKPDHNLLALFSSSSSSSSFQRMLEPCSCDPRRLWLKFSLGFLTALPVNAYCVNIMLHVYLIQPFIPIPTDAFNTFFLWRVSLGELFLPSLLSWWINQYFSSFSISSMPLKSSGHPLCLRRSNKPPCDRSFILTDSLIRRSQEKKNAYVYTCRNRVNLIDQIYLGRSKILYIW